MGRNEAVEVAGDMASEANGAAAAGKSPSQLGKNWATGISGCISKGNRRAKVVVKME